MLIKRLGTNNLEVMMELSMNKMTPSHIGGSGTKLQRDLTRLYGSKGSGISSVGAPRIGLLGGLPATHQPVCLQVCSFL